MSEYIVKCTEVIGISGNVLQIPDYIDLNSEIMRCRDCEYATKRWTPAHREEVTYCERFVHLAGYNQSAYVEPDGFCAWAERKDA